MAVLILTLLTILAWIVGLLTGWQWCFWLAIAIGSAQAIQTAYLALRERRLDINILMLMAGAGAVAIQRYFDAATLFLLFSLSNTLESYALGRTERGIAALVKLRPQTARRITDGSVETVAVELLRPGDAVQVDAFSQIPADGEIVAGSTSVDESVMTGESIPVSKTIGDSLMAGTQNLEGVLTVRVTATAENSSIDRIIALVKEARENKGGYERISVWFGQSYTIAVIGAFILSLIVRWAMHPNDFGKAFFESLVLLVGLSPCALVISTPAAILAALANASRNGVLVRGGAVLEAVANVKAVAFDKTGTLTIGSFEVKEAWLCNKCWKPGETMSEQLAEALAMAGALESGSTHPLSTAISKLASTVGSNISAVDAQVVGGLGVQGTIEGKLAKIGRPQFFDSLRSDTTQTLENLRARGFTAVVMQHGEMELLLGLSDMIRPGADRVATSLRDIGMEHVLLLTGDHAESAKLVSSVTGIDEVHAELMPGEKKEQIDRLKSRYGSVMMVGDGVNDAPSLAGANVGIAFGGLGSDVAIAAADAVLVQDKLEKIPLLIRLSKATGAIVKQNIFLSLLSISVLAVLAFFGVLPLTWAVLGHEGTTVIVILNGLRLLR